MTISSPLRRQRQSIRTPQRRKPSQKENDEDNYDPFVPAKSSENGDILKQTLLAQLNARVSADPSNPFGFSRDARKTVQPAPRFEDNHQKMFKSMKSIGPTRRPSNTSTTTRRSLEKESKIALPLPKRRTESQHHEAATPSKRRRLETRPSPPSNVPKLSFNFTQPVKEPAKIDSKDVKNEETTINTPVKTPLILKGIRQSTDQEVVTAVKDADSYTAVSSTGHIVKQKREKMDSPIKTREEKRLEQRKKATVQRMMKKTASMPGWK